MGFLSIANWFVILPIGWAQQKTEGPKEPLSSIYHVLRILRALSLLVFTIILEDWNCYCHFTDVMLRMVHVSRSRTRYCHICKWKTSLSIIWNNFCTSVLVCKILRTVLLRSIFFCFKSNFNNDLPAHLQVVFLRSLWCCSSFGSTSL